MRTTLSSFDGTESVRGELLEPEGTAALLAALEAPIGVVARGAGLSYCAASAGDDVRSVSTLRLDRILDFDPQAGTVVVEPGVRMGALVDFANARGFTPNALPGHPSITVGGCLGVNVHGKSQSHGGNFIDSVDHLVLCHPDHGEVQCSREHEPELFALTVGGFGLTGVVTRARLRLERLGGASVLRRREPVANLLEAAELMRERAGEAATLYSWNDLNRRGDAFGRGFVYSERYREEPLAPRGRFRHLDPARRGRLRARFFNRPGAVCFGRAYALFESLRAAEEHLDLRSAAFPINGKEIYFALFGRPGFREYQMLVPHAVWSDTVKEVDALLARSPVAVTLGSLKLFEGRTTLLNFCGSGVCLTIDVPATPASLDLMSHLDRLVLDVGGIANLSKDGRLSRETVQRMFPEYEKFSRSLRAFDPKRRFDSALRRRIGV